MFYHAAFVATFLAWQARCFIAQRRLVRPIVESMRLYPERWAGEKNQITFKHPDDRERSILVRWECSALLTLHIHDFPQGLGIYGRFLVRRAISRWSRWKVQEEIGILWKELRRPDASMD